MINKEKYISTVDFNPINFSESAQQKVKAANYEYGLSITDQFKIHEQQKQKALYSLSEAKIKKHEIPSCFIKAEPESLSKDHQEDVNKKIASKNPNNKQLQTKSKHSCPHSCPTCKKQFASRSNLNRHIRAKNERKTKKCPFCEKKYVQVGALKYHVRTHFEGEFVCQLCHKTFTRSWLLKRHIRGHTGEKPYVCSVCSKAFIDRSNCISHQKIHKLRAIEHSIKRTFKEL